MAQDVGQGLKAYRRVQVESMTPADLVLATYDVAIRACEQRDMRRAGEAVSELMNALDFTYQEVAGSLVVLYDWIYRQIREGAFDEAKRFLCELRESWSQAMADEARPQTSTMERAAADATG